MNLATIRNLIVAIGLSAVTATASFGQSTLGRDYILPSWGDIVYSYGPGVDPALDCPSAFEHMITHWQGRGFRGVFLRTDLAQLDPASFRRNPIDQQQNPRLAAAWKYIDQVAEGFDVHKVGNAISEQKGFEFWAWHAHTFSDGAPETAGAPGPYRMWPWSYVVKYTYEHPEAVTTDRSQKKRQWMVREYGYAEARATKVAEFVYMARKFGLKHFVVENRSEASQVQDPPDNADRFGFNDIVVKDMHDRYGVDILTDPRFDVDNPRFNSLDPMVENWHKLRGEYFTQFFRDLRKALNDVDPKIQICASLAGERIGPPMGNWFTDWRTWVDEGLIDAIVTPCNFDAYPTSPTILQTYITCPKQDRGIIPLQVIRDYIKHSKHPAVRLISSGGSFFFPNPPAGGDSWRTTDWYDSYQLAWYQRWSQLMRDYNDVGYIKFIDQGFDDFPVDSSYHSGGYGNKGYVPALRACPGVWCRLGRANDTLPTVESTVRYGDRGRAVRLTSDPTKSTELVAFHSSTADRSLYYSCIEPAIVNGEAEFEFRLFRESDDSAVSVYFQDASNAGADIAVRVAGVTGEIFYSQAGKWRASGIVMPKKNWQQIRMTVDFAKGAYSAFLLLDKAKLICSDVPYVAPEARFIAADDGTGNQVELKPCKMLNQLDFVPEGRSGSITYVDDVSVRWKPSIPYEKPCAAPLFKEDFESFPAGERWLDRKPAIGQWSLHTTNSSQVVAENGTSYGEGVMSLRMQGNTELRCNPAENSPKKKVVLDIDVFLRSSSYYVNIMPSSNAETSHAINLLLCDAHGAEVSGLRNEDGHWSYLENGAYKRSAVPVALDCWNHVQMSVDLSNKTSKIVLQTVGEMPAVLAKCAVPDSQDVAPRSLIIKTTNLDDAYESHRGTDVSLVNFSCIDNIHFSAE
jgi:hypothetical protein